MKVVGLLALMLLTCVAYAIGSGNNDIARVFAFIFFPAAIALYFYPAICAMNEHPRATAIFALNLLAGWTFVGWVAAFIWALTKPQPSISVGDRDLSSATPFTTNEAASNDTKTCPFCAESIKRAAIKCKHCGADLEPVPPPIMADLAYGWTIRIPCKPGENFDRVVLSLQTAGYPMLEPDGSVAVVGFFAEKQKANAVRESLGARLALYGDLYWAQASSGA